MNRIEEYRCPPKCCYCKTPETDSMLVMEDSMAHVDCVITKLNEQLDPDYFGEGNPLKIIGYLYEPKPDESRLLTGDEIDKLIYPRGQSSKAVAKAQDLKTAHIKDAECAKEKAEFGLSVNEAAYHLCQQKIAKLFGEIEELFEPTVPMSLDYEKWRAYKTKRLKEKE